MKTIIINTGQPDSHNGQMMCIDERERGEMGKNVIERNQTSLKINLCIKSKSDIFIVHTYIQLQLYDKECT